MTNKTVFYILALQILNILKCTSFATENKAEPNFEFNEAENMNKMSTRNENWSASETETWKPAQEQNYKVNEMNLRNLSFVENMKKCIKDHQYEITLNFKKGKTIILNCIKEAMIRNLMQYLTVSQNFSISFFDGLFELAKISDPLCSSVENLKSPNNCKSDYIKNIDDLKKSGWISNNRKYLKIYSSNGNIEKTGDEKLKNTISDEEQLHRIEKQQNKLLSEVIRSFSDDYWEKKEIEELKNEINDSKLLDTFNALTRNYVLKIKYFPGATAKIRRGNDSRIIFDVDIEEHDTSVKDDEESENEVEAKNWRQSRLDFSSDSEESSQGNNQNNQSKKKKKKKKDEKESRKQRKQKKKLKKHLSYLLFPIMIQLALLPFVLKKLFFLAMGALMAGKLAMILVVYRLLRNMKVHDENYYLRLEHYGYKQGEEYGAWVNGRRFRRFLNDSLSETLFKGRNPVMNR